MTRRNTRFARLLVAVPFAVVAACGGGGGDSADTTTTAAPESTAATTTAAEETTTTTEPEPTVDPLVNLRAATVKIGSQGTFVDPDFGLQTNTAGIGSGFIIDPSGIAVTNNHVVTGAALLQVYLDGQTRPVNARVLGVSECSDLAVIDIDGDGFSYLDFADPSIIIEGLEVYAAGFPLTLESTVEEVDYTLTRGIISSTNASGETRWASVDSVLEHDARIRGGNSGGPLVTPDGVVVGVNYAGFAEADQNFAIAIDRALPIIEQLRAGQDVESLGINGQAVFDDFSGTSGIWVASVESGSPASNAGIRAGDIITSLEGLILATDGTMSDYCDIIRTRGPDAVYAVEVLRYATEEFLEGEINGRPLEQSFSFAQQVDAPADTDGPQGGTYTEYMMISDDTGMVNVEVPVEWSDIDGSYNDTFGPSVYAAPDLDGFLNGWNTPGVIVEVSGELGFGDTGFVLDDIRFGGQCTSLGREPYEDPLYSGEWELWVDCGGTATQVVTIAAVPDDGTFLIRVGAIIVTDRDLEALDRIIATFYATS